MNSNQSSNNSKPSAGNAPNTSETTSNTAGWPSKTGNPSGSGRSNNPPRKQESWNKVYKLMIYL